MDVSQIATMQVAGAAALAQQAATMAMVKTAAEAQMQMANILALQAEQAGRDGFSVYA